MHPPDIEWSDSEGKILATARDVVDKCLACRRKFKDLDSHSVEGHKSDDPRIQGMIPQADSNPYSPPYSELVAQTHVIVMVSPPLVVVTDVAIWTYTAELVNGEFINEVRATPDGKGEVVVYMPHGFVPGSIVPDSPSIEWYSPEYDCVRTPVTRMSPDEFVIKTPHHELLGKLKGDRWIISVKP